MQNTVLNAKRKGVSIGAHPGFADLHGFGRRAMSLAEDDLVALLVYQLGAVAAMGRAHDWPISHVKPHGALNNQACADPALAAIVARTVARFDPALILLAPAGSELGAAGQAAGLSVRFEIFADRTYEADGQLTPRLVEGSGIDDVQVRVKRMQLLADLPQCLQASVAGTGGVDELSLGGHRA